MPGDNGQLRTIRKEIRDSGPGMFIFVKVEKVIPKGYPETNEVQASFWKVFEDQENPGLHSIAKICWTWKFSFSDLLYRYIYLEIALP